MNRRRFLGQAVAGLVAGPAVPPFALAGAAAAPVSPREPRFTGFVVSDSHFGWDHPKQPAPGVIRRAMTDILARFPDLDVFIDSGDAHHNGAGDTARAAWTEIIANGCGPRPFFYCVGNHEQGGPGDTETRSQRLGNLSCRPYQSWTLQGIHLVVLPQLMRACYVNEEALDWLQLDLESHAGLTSLVISHNALRDTTDPGFDIGYRQVVNSGAVLDLLRRHPNVLAWLHGHNHTFELVEKFGKLFASNGRLGGFDPGGPGRSGEGHLGGIYFEVGPNHLTLRGYSASRGAFFDTFDAGSAFLHRTLKIRTSLDPAAPAATSYGMGRSREGQRLPVHHHHVGPRVREELRLAPVESPALNDDPGLALYTARTERDGRPTHKILAGFDVAPHRAAPGQPDETWEWTASGLRFQPAHEAIPRMVRAPGRADGQWRYYRCAPGTRLLGVLEAQAPVPGPTARLLCRVHDSEGREWVTLPGPEWALPARAGRFEHRFEIPDLADVASIYRDPGADLLLQVGVEAVFSGLSQEVVLRRLELRLDRRPPHSARAGLVAEGRFLGAGFSDDVPSNARRVVEVRTGAAPQLTWLIRQTGIEWQIRNAAAVWRRDHLEIGPLRNPFSPAQEILLAPLGRRPPSAAFVHRLRRITRVRLHPGPGLDRTLALEVVAADLPAEIELIAPRAPRRVGGAAPSRFSDGRFHLAVTALGRVEIEAG